MVAEPPGAPGHDVELKDGLRAVHGRAADGEERDRLWARWGESSDHYDAWAAMRSGRTAVVVLEPRVGGAILNGAPGGRLILTAVPLSGASRGWPRACEAIG